MSEYITYTVLRNTELLFLNILPFSSPYNTRKGLFYKICNPFGPFVKGEKSLSSFYRKFESRKSNGCSVVCIF